MPPVRTLAHVRAQDRRPLLGGHPAGEREELVVGVARDGVERGGHDLHLAVGIEVREHHLRARLRGDLAERAAAADSAAALVAAR